MEPDKQSEIFLESGPTLAELSDAELLQRWKAGDERAAEILVDRYALRLIALVAKRLNRRLRDQIEPADVVQSAMGSFFLAARHSRIQVSQSASLWQLLATFARRKMARAIEKQAAAKRGGGALRLSIEDIDLADSTPTAVEEQAWTAELIGLLEAELPPDERDLIPLLLAGSTQQEIAKSLNIDQRTVRRRITKLREMLSTTTSPDETRFSTSPNEFSSTVVPRVDYRAFVLGRLVGSGGFGKVYRAAMQADGSIVAVKFLRKAFWHCDEARQSFLREIETASQIRHPSITQYIGWGQSPQGGPYVISQWIEGTSLQNIETPTPKGFIDILNQVCDALIAVHDAGLVHGDLTPNNILVGPRGKVTVIDFGFSQRVARTFTDAVQTSNMLLGGTIGFAAPEQLSPAFGSISARTDIYALGCLAFWYLTGRAPNDASQIEHAMSRTLAAKETIIPPAFASSPQAQMLHRVATLALKKAPTARPDSAHDVQRLLATSLLGRQELSSE